jgi:DNA (cytosine-5)-methyltransferase 1
VIISYNRLWKLLIDKNIKKTDLCKIVGFSTDVIVRLGKNDPVSMEMLAKICIALQCGLDDIVEITGDTEIGGN